jgi:general secretion pathway protein D
MTASLTRLATALAMTLLAGAPFRVASATEELLAYHTSPAADGSVQLELDFDGPAPRTQVVHDLRDNAKVVLIGVERGPDLPASIAPGGAIVRGNIAAYAHIGLVVDLDLTNDLRPRTETHGSRVIVHIPAASSDEEAHVKVAQQISQAPGVTIVRLSYADVSEIAGLIKNGIVVPSVDQFTAQSPFTPPTPPPNSSFSGSSGSQPTIATPSYAALPTGSLIPKDTAQGVFINEHVSVDRRLNAVILRGTPDEIAPYQRMIALVDTARRSVLLETQVVELTDTGAYDLGINYSANGSLATATFSAGNTLQAGTTPGINATATQPLTSLSLSAQLLALQQKGQAKILAQPRILAADNRIAAILSGEAVPIFNSILTGAGGSTIVQQQIQYINVGVSLEILPRIAADGSVTVDVFSEVSSIIGYIGNTPQIAVRQELTTASATDGQSILMGGLVQDQEIKTLSKVPGMGDLPLIGPLFRQTVSSSQKTSLYLVITPHVLTKSSTAAQPPSPSP